MALEMDNFILVLAVLCCIIAAAVLVGPVLRKDASTAPEVDQAAGHRLSAQDASSSMDDKTPDKKTGKPDAVETAVLAERQPSLSDSGSNDSGPAAVSPQRRSTEILPVSEWPAARWSKVIDATLPKHAVAVILQVLSASRRQKQRE